MMKLELMNAVEFESTMTLGGHIALPPEVVGDIPAGEQIRVVVMWEPSSQDSDWQSTGRRKWLSTTFSGGRAVEHYLFN